MQIKIIIKCSTLLELSQSGTNGKKKDQVVRLGLFGGRGWIRTTEVVDNRFTVCPLWPLGNSSMSYIKFIAKMELVDGLEPPTC
jgi:hypothetical protein